MKYRKLKPDSERVHEGACHDKRTDGEISTELIYLLNSNTNNYRNLRFENSMLSVQT